ncbi:hypothetical protein MKW98_001726 [Papaver atlanticum]|uniref:Uncharacterized protein n=1 Tax=Papaver atlanticum TaxID=357466 RepID=A0AAD4S672_9MAGN|nr:hypothetical protein MKW98_001726 [Papaver atlanticum]
MEGLIPFVYRAVVEYRNGGAQASNMGSSTGYSKSPSTSYMRLPLGDSGRFSKVQLFSSNSSMVVVTATSAVQSPLVCRSTCRQLASS